MLYYDASNGIIKDGFEQLRNEAYAPEADSSTKAYYDLLNAIAHGEGFNFLTDWEKFRSLREADALNVLKELLYGIETERITDSYTHKNIVEETLETLFDMYL